MPLDPTRVPAAARVAALALCGVACAAALLAAAGCARSASFPRLCSLFGSCAPEATLELPPPPPLVYEPEPVEVPEVGGGRLLLRSITFAVGSAEIDAGSAVALDVAAGEILERTGIRIRVEGHSDDAGGAEANEALSLRRAEVVRRYLVRKGVAPQRLETLARGASGPVGSNATEEGRARNRRVELVVL